MSVGPFGRMALGPTGTQVTFTCDPRTYKPWQWQKRKSVHPGIGGSMTIQDFGIFAKDAVIEIQSPLEEFMDWDVAALIHAMYRARGAVYLLTDWLGNSFTVFIEEFSIDGDQRLPGGPYQMKLHVLGVNQLFGSAYSGS